MNKHSPPQANKHSPPPENQLSTPQVNKPSAPRFDVADVMLQAHWMVGVVIELKQGGGGSVQVLTMNLLWQTLRSPQNFYFRE